MIVITTPTGQIGRQVLNQLVDSDEDVRVIVRDPSRLPAGLEERVEVVVGSHNQHEVLARAFAGADSVLWVVPPNPKAQNVTDYYLNFTRPACDAITENGVARVVGITSLGHGWPKDAGNLSAAFAMDDLITTTEVAYRALAMPSFMENLLGQIPSLKAQSTFAMTNAANRPLRTVATSDVAAAATTLLLDDVWTGQEILPVVGPDALTPEGMAQTMSEVLDRPVNFRQIEEQDFTTRMLSFGLSDAWVQGMVTMTTAQSEGIYETTLSAPAFGAAPAPHLESHTSFEQWCRTVLRPAIMA